MGEAQKPSPVGAKIKAGGRLVERCLLWPIPQMFFQIWEFAGLDSTVADIEPQPEGKEK